MKLIQKIKCNLGFHQKGMLRPAVGGRNVKRCIHCDVIVEEESMMGQVKWKGKLNLPRLKLPKGKITDSWFK